MFCRFCGNEIPEGGQFCANCGKAVEAGAAAQPGEQQTDTSQPDGQQGYNTQPGRQQEYTSQPGGQQPYNTFQTGGQQPYPQVQVNPVQNHPMAWFKFIIYFQLFANMVLMLYNVLHGFLGIAYGDDADLIYAICPGLKAVDVIYGFICIALIAGAFIVRQRLAHYKKNAPMQYIVFVAAVLVLGLLHTIAGVAVIGATVPYAAEAGVVDVAGNILGTVVGAAIFIPVNYIYFNKRKELFVKSMPKL